MVPSGHSVIPLAFQYTQFSSNTDGFQKDLPRGNLMTQIISSSLLQILMLWKSFSLVLLWKPNECLQMHWWSLYNTIYWSRSTSENLLARTYPHLLFMACAVCVHQIPCPPTQGGPTLHGKKQKVWSKNFKDKGDCILKLWFSLNSMKGHQ